MVAAELGAAHIQISTHDLAPLKQVATGWVDYTFGYPFELLWNSREQAQDWAFAYFPGSESWMTNDPAGLSHCVATPFARHLADASWRVAGRPAVLKISPRHLAVKPPSRGWAALTRSGFRL